MARESGEGGNTPPLVRLKICFSKPSVPTNPPVSRAHVRGLTLIFNRRVEIILIDLVV